MPQWEIEITDARSGWGTRGFSMRGPGVYITDDPNVMDAAKDSAHVFVRELKDDEEPAEEGAYVAESTSSGPLTVQDLRKPPTTVKTCPDCEQTYKDEHRLCPVKEQAAAEIESESKPEPEPEATPELKSKPKRKKRKSRKKSG